MNVQVQEHTHSGTWEVVEVHVFEYKIAAVIISEYVIEEKWLTGETFAIQAQGPDFKPSGPI